jgi:hypothetical protein
MSDELEELEDDINHDWWTVIGFSHETWERWAGHYDCLNPRMAEDLAQMDAKEQGFHLAVVSVIEGKIWPADQYATWVDPDVRDQPEMNRKLVSLGYLR